MIKENHFKTLKENYQIPENIPIRLAYTLEKCYYDGVEGVGIYKQMLKVRLRFPLSTLHRELLKCLGLSVNQVSPNTWRIFIAMEILYGAMSDDARSLTVREFLHYYRLDEIDKSRGCTVLFLGICCWRLYMKLWTQTGIGKADISS